MRIEKTKLLVCELVYWVKLNADIENAVKHCSAGLVYQNAQLQEKTTSFEVSSKL